MTNAKTMDCSQELSVSTSYHGDAVFTTDMDGTITFMNSVAEQFTGWSLQNATGHPLIEVVQLQSEPGSGSLDKLMNQSISDRQPMAIGHGTIINSQDLSERKIEGRIAPLLTSDQQVSGTILSLQDLSEREKLEVTQARLAAIVESSVDAIVSKTLDGIIRSWNAGAERLFGYAASEAIGQSIMLIVPSDRQDEERHIIERLIRGERVEHFETLRITKTGQPIHISLTISPMRDSSGKIIGASKIARDITAQKQAEEERQELLQAIEDERARLAEVFHGAPSFLAVLRGPDHVFELANERYYHLVGNRQLKGKAVRDALPEIEGQGFFELLDQVYTTGIPFQASETRAIIQQREDSPPQEVFLDFVYQPLTESDGTVSGILVQGIDLTERKRAEETIATLTTESERSRRLYETIMSATPDFIYIFSLDYRVIYANASLLTMWGKTWEETNNKTFSEIGYEDWHAEMHCREIDQVRRTKQPIRGEAPFHGVHGRRIYDYIFVPVLNTDGEVEAVAGTTRDVTERREMEDLLRESDRNKDEFIALLAHELRNPLAPLVNGLQVLRLTQDDPDTSAEVRTIMERQLDHMVRLIDDLLDISRLSQNKMELRLSRVLLADVVNSALETVQSLVEASHHHLTVLIPSEPVYLNADLTRLAQVFSNLLTNSCKYTPPGGEISLTARKDNSEVVIAVQDNGIGIPLEAQAHVFDMFNQVDRSIERSSGGLGIGLALVKSLVEKHAGTITVVSQGQNQGTTFTVRLPIDITASDDQIEPTTDTSQTQKKPARKVLVVDDNYDSANSMAMMLKFMGNDVTTVHDGLAAVETAAQLHPDLILMDIGMPRLNGYEATRRIREQEPLDHPAIIIALTGWGQESDRAQSREAGCNGHLVKPVNLPDLEKMLEELESAALNRQ